MNSDKNLLIKNFIWLLSLRGLEILIPLLTIPYLLRTIGVEKYGFVSFGYAFGLYFGAFVQYGFGVTATRDIARRRHNGEAVERLCSSVLASSGLLALGATSLAALIVLAFPQLRADWQLLILSLGQALLQSLFPTWLFQGMERMAFITYFNLASKVSFVIGLFLLVNGPDDYLYVPLLNLISAAVVLICSLYITRRVFRLRLSLPGWLGVRHTLINGRHAFVNQLAPNLYNNSTTVLLGLLWGGHAVGLYTAATKVVDAVSSLGYILSNAFLPYLSRSLVNHDIFKTIMLLTGLAGTLCLLAGADLIGGLLHPTEGPAIAALLRMASASVFMIFAMLTFGTNYLMLRKKEATAGHISLCISLAFFLIALALVPAFGAMGGIAILVGARTFMASAFYMTYWRNKTEKSRISK